MKQLFLVLILSSAFSLNANALRPIAKPNQQEKPMPETTSDKSQVPIEREDYKPGAVSEYKRNNQAPQSKRSAEQLIRGMLCTSHNLI